MEAYMFVPDWCVDWKPVNYSLYRRLLFFALFQLEVRSESVSHTGVNDCQDAYAGRCFLLLLENGTGCSFQQDVIGP